MKILVTGGNGFIGSTLIPQLQKLGHDVYNIERHSMSRPKRAMICPTFITDLKDGNAVRKILSDINPSIVIHLAAISAVAYSHEHPQEVIESNLIGTINLAEASLKETHNFKQFLFAGTSEEYGNNGCSIQVETNPLVPTSPYAISKVACEQYLSYLKAAYDFPTTILRPFNTYGRINDSHFLIERTITQMLTKDVVYLIDPTPIRDWMYVADHVSAYILCIANENAIGETFNFCTGKGHSVKDTVGIIANLTNFKGEIVWGSAPKRPSESTLIVGTYKKANELLGWRPEYTLEDGLRETLSCWNKKL